MKNKKILFLVIFVGLGLISVSLPVAKIMGSSQNFTVFEFLGPLPGLFLGTWPGALAVLLVKVLSFLINRGSLDWVTIIRFFPMVLAAIYFGTKSKKITVVPILAMILFIAHPIGRQVWYYSLYWLIPIFASFRKDRLFLRSLGATFTAHSVGSVAFLYAFNLPAAVWLTLIPVVFLERMLFATGIWASYLAFNTSLAFLVKKKNWTFLETLVNPRYVLNQRFLSFYS